MIEAPDNKRTIFHVDVNSAFLSWSAVKRLQEDPGAVDLRTIPSAAGGDAEPRHGIITAKSIPAKKYGIKTAMTVAEALRLCPNLVLVPADFETYRKSSKLFIGILKQYTDLVEQASIDEAYMDVTGTEELYREYETDEWKFPVSLAHHIRNEIKTALGFTVNVGVSTNKLLAKMASDFEKPDKVHTLYPDEVASKMWPLPVGDLFGCGRQTADRLKTYGIRTIGEAAALDEHFLQGLIGEKTGTYIWRSANGLSDSPVEPVRDEAKSVSNETTLAHDLVDTNFNNLAPELIRNLSASVGRRLREKGLRGGTVVVSIKTSDFHRKSRQAQLSVPTDSAPAIEKTALLLLRELCYGEDAADGPHLAAGRGAGSGGGSRSAVRATSRGVFGQELGVRLVGVGVTNISNGENRQMSIFDYENEMDENAQNFAAGAPAGSSSRKALNLMKQHSLDAMEDAINGKFGAGTLKRGL